MNGSAEEGVYRKHQSYVGLENAPLRAQALGRVAAVDADDALKAGLNTRERALLTRALDDLFRPGEAGRPAHFSLSDYALPQVASFETLKEVARYIAHRYLYEVFPQTRELDAYPPYLQIEPTSVCNYRCVFCYQSDPTFSTKQAGFMGFMPLERFRDVVDAAEGQVEFGSIASRGEPSLNPDFEKMLAYTRGKFLDLKVNTNAWRLSESMAHAFLQSGVKTLVISADAADAELYGKLRRKGRLDRVLENVERFQKIRATQYGGSKMVLRVSGVKVSDSQGLDDMMSTWGGLVDQVMFVSYNPSHSVVAESEGDFSSGETIYTVEKNNVLQPCSELWRRMFVWWDGTVNPCESDYKSKLAVGKWDDSSLTGLWRGEAYERLRQAHTEPGGRQGVEPCARCTVT